MKNYNRQKQHNLVLNTSTMPNSPVFFTYILTNWNKTVLYTGMTNNLARRLVEHWLGKAGSFTTRYKACYLVWYETTKYVLNAIEGEKHIKGLTRQKKKTSSMNLILNGNF